MADNIDKALNGLDLKTDSLPSDWMITLVNPKEGIPAQNMTIARFTELFGDLLYRSKSLPPEGGVFIMFHIKGDDYPVMVSTDKWISYQRSGEIADGVAIVEGGKVLVVAPTEAPTTGLMWSSADINAGGTRVLDISSGLNDWNGKANTEAQIKHPECSGTSYAPGFCAAYSRVNANGYGLDSGKWWLPSIGEMMMIFANMRKVNYALSLIDGATQLSEDSYWTSTEYSDAIAWRFNTLYSSIGGRNKSSSKNRVRAVSAFMI